MAFFQLRVFDGEKNIQLLCHDSTCFVTSPNQRVADLLLGIKVVYMGMIHIYIFNCLCSWEILGNLHLQSQCVTM